MRNETLLGYRLRTGLSRQKFAESAGVDPATYRSAENGGRIQDVKAYAIVTKLNELLQLEEPLTISSLKIETV